MTKPPAMTEDMLLEGVLDLCKLLRCRTLHIRPARTANGWRTPVQGDGKGFPDLLILTYDDRLLFRELKSNTGHLMSHQIGWANGLMNADLDYAVWRPSDWFSGRIQRELSPATRGAA